MNGVCFQREKKFFPNRWVALKLRLKKKISEMKKKFKRRGNKTIT